MSEHLCCYIDRVTAECIDLLKMGLLRRIFGPKRDEITGEWRELLNEELNDLCLSPTIVRVI
jgi:hypothetical protein